MDGGLGIRQQAARSTRDGSRSTMTECDEFPDRGANFSRQPSMEVVAVSNAVRSDRDLTTALIEQIAGGELGAKLRSQVAGWHPQASREEIDDAFQEACLRAGGRCRGRTEGEVFTWLRTTTHRELWLIKRRAGRELLVDPVELSKRNVMAPVFQAAAVEGAPDQVLLDKEGETEVTTLTDAVLARLSERQRQVIALHSHGRQRAEIAEQLGITPRSVKRAIERTLAEGRDELVRLAGRGCEPGEGLVARLAFGLANGWQAS
jgi:RNA polymerase sigma factor (sigma-70 family)